MDETQVGTAVARLPEIKEGEIESLQKFRKAGAAAIAQRKELQRLKQMLDGTTWGKAMTQRAQDAVVAFCSVVGANPQRHVNVLGGNIYLNGDFWSDKLSSDQLFHHYEQREIGKAAEAALRERAKSRKAMALEIEDTLEKGVDDDTAKMLRGQALRLRAEAYADEEDANQMAIDRSQSGAPEWAVNVVETTIVRFINATPIDRIRSGEITDLSPYLVRMQPVWNWAGGRVEGIKQRMKETGWKWEDVTKSMKPDPIGDNEPAKTAATRSLRRAGDKGFSSWMSQYSEQVERAERWIEAEFEVVGYSEEPQTAMLASGEPQAVAAEDARDLPVRGEEPQEPQEAQWEEEPHQEPKEPAFDATDARKRLFATLKGAGITKDADRKKWAADNGLPASTKEWGSAQYERAQELLLQPVRDPVIRGCETLGIGVNDLAMQVLGISEPDYYEHWASLKAVVDVRLGAQGDDGEEEGGEEQPQMEL